jgi:hypothetical protein
MEKYTTGYQQHLKQVEVAQGRFDLKPSRKTATALSNLKNKQFSREQMYTPDWIGFQKQEELVLKHQLKQCIKQLKQFSWEAPL